MLKRKLVQVFSYFPLKLNFFILIFASFLVFYWSKQNYFLVEEKSVFYLLLKALATILLFFSGLIFCISLVTVLLAWIHFVIIKKNTNRPLLKIKFGEGNYSQAGKVPLEVVLFSVIRPLLGIVKVKLAFDNHILTEDIVLNEDYRQQKKLIRIGISANSWITLHDRKEYNLLKTFIFYEDIFRLFSIPYIEKSEKVMYTVPLQGPAQVLEVLPNKTEEQDQRIQLPKKIQGEYVNYKNFEAGDDIRRIVWEIYAKSKELVIRIPETTDPYASHIYIYPSFYNAMGDKLSSSFDHEFLNYYKDKIRNVYESIANNGYELRYHSDQELNSNFGVATQEAVLFKITSSMWHKDNSVYDFFGKLTDGVLVVSSLTSPEDLNNALQNKKSGTYVILVKLSEIFNNRLPFSIKRIFFRQPESLITVLKRNWLLSGYRIKILKNEKKLTSIINNQIFN